MKRAWRAFRNAVAYFTVLPAGSAVLPDAYAFSYLPAAGAIAGALAGTAAWGLSFGMPHAVVVVAAFAFTIVVSGAIHFDGFLDSCDALFASVPAVRRLEIFKDPAHGTFAVVGMAIATSLWIAVLWPVAPGQFPGLLAFTGYVSRLASVSTALFVPYARGGKPSALILAVSAAGAVLLSLYVWKWAWVAIPAAALLCLGMAIFAARRLGGSLVGDVYGFMIVITEAVMLAALRHP